MKKFFVLSIFGLLFNSKLFANLNDYEFCGFEFIFAVESCIDKTASERVEEHTNTSLGEAHLGSITYLSGDHCLISTVYKNSEDKERFVTTVFSIKHGKARLNNITVFVDGAVLGGDRNSCDILK